MPGQRRKVPVPIKGNPFTPMWKMGNIYVTIVSSMNKLINTKINKLNEYLQEVEIFHQDYKIL